MRILFLGLMFLVSSCGVVGELERPDPIFGKKGDVTTQASKQAADATAPQAE